MTNYGLLVIRIGLGITMMMHGFPKFNNIQGFAQSLTKAGIPGGEIAALLAAITEFGGGLFLLLGALTKLTSFVLAFNMAVAVYFHMALGGGFAGPNSYSHALELLIVFVGLSFIGAGSLSVDNIFFKRK